MGSRKASGKSSLWINEMTGVFESTDLAAIRSAWQGVFATPDAFSWPFKGAVGTGGFFFPTDGYHLTREQYMALVSAIQSIGETGFLLSVVEGEGPGFLERTEWHWTCE